MISMQQLEELENRIVKALQLIGDLRTENAKLENENETLKSEIEEANLTIEEKEQLLQKVKQDLAAAVKELEELHNKMATMQESKFWEKGKPKQSSWNLTTLIANWLGFGN